MNCRFPSNLTTCFRCIGNRRAKRNRYRMGTGCYPRYSGTMRPPGCSRFDSKAISAGCQRTRGRSLLAFLPRLPRLRGENGSRARPRHPNERPAHDYLRNDSCALSSARNWVWRSVYLRASCCGTRRSLPALVRDRASARRAVHRSAAGSRG